MTQSLGRFLNSGDTLSRLREHADRLQRLQQTLENLLSGYLGNHCTVANIKGNKLILLTRSGAGAAKLRQMIPTLLQGFVNAGFSIGSVQVKVIPQENAAAASKPVIPRTLTAGGRQSIEAFCATLPPDSPLRESLERLVSRSTAK